VAKDSRSKHLDLVGVGNFRRRLCVIYDHVGFSDKIWFWCWFLRFYSVKARRSFKSVDRVKVLFSRTWTGCPRETLLSVRLDQYGILRFGLGRDIRSLLIKRPEGRVLFENYTDRFTLSSIFYAPFFAPLGHWYEQRDWRQRVNIIIIVFSARRRIGPVFPLERKDDFIAKPRTVVIVFCY